MVAQLQHGMGNPARLMPTRRLRVVAAPPGVNAPQHEPEDLGFLLESARMDREMAREMPRGFQRPGRHSIMAALMNMSNQRFAILGVGVLLLTVGLLALRFPVFLSDFDHWGFQINCGSGFQSALTQASIADSAGTHFVDQCHTAIAVRRAWAIPLAVGGALLLIGLMVSPPRQGSAEAATTVETRSGTTSGRSPLFSQAA